MKADVVIIGAGAAGLLAAGRAAERGLSVLVLEKMERAGRKLLISGKGRCNITNIVSLADFLKHIHPDGKFLRPAFVRFFNEDIIKLLHELGVPTKTERGGRVFPESDKAADVVAALLKYAVSSGTEIIYNASVEKIIAENASVKAVLFSKNGLQQSIETNNLILCSGGKSYPATGSSGEAYQFAKELGHSITDLRPSLVPLVTEGTLAVSMQGLSLKNVNASLWVDGKKRADEFGEMLFTHFGLSGPIILTLSSLAVDALAERRKVEIIVDLKPALDDKVLDARLLRDLNTNGKKQLANLFREWLPAKMIPVFLKELQLDPQKAAHQIKADERKMIRLLMKNFRFIVTGHRGFKEAIITAGGISLKEINAETMESKLMKGLYFAGEIIDADADTGGFNLQIAWSTGCLAADSIPCV